MDWNSEEARVEGEANCFAANILMPRDDFQDQVRRRKTDLYLFDVLTDRYKVSLSAAILRWLGFTAERAMIVVGKDGFIDWAWSSKPLLRSGVFYRPRQETIELPAASLAARRDASFDNKTGVTHPSGIWIGDEEVKEMAVFTNEYSNMTISLLKYPGRACGFSPTRKSTQKTRWTVSSAGSGDRPASRGRDPAPTGKARVSRLFGYARAAARNYPC